MSDERKIASFSSSEDGTGQMVIKLFGDLDIVGAEQVQTELDRLLQRHLGRIVFDLGGLEFMDSSGIALLLRAASTSGSVEVLHPSPIIRRIIEVTGLSDILRVELEPQP